MAWACIDWLTSHSITTRRGASTGLARTSSIGSQPVRRERAMVGRSATRCPVRSMASRRVRRVGQLRSGRFQPPAERGHVAAARAARTATSASAGQLARQPLRDGERDCRCRRPPATAGGRVDPGQAAALLVVAGRPRAPARAARPRRGARDRAAARVRVHREDGVVEDGGEDARRRRRGRRAGAPGRCGPSSTARRRRSAARRARAADEVLDRGEADRHAAARSRARARRERRAVDAAQQGGRHAHVRRRRTMSSTTISGGQRRAAAGAWSTEVPAIGQQVEGLGLGPGGDRAADRPA